VEVLDVAVVVEVIVGVDVVVTVDVVVAAVRRVTRKSGCPLPSLVAL
jgi:hypothetical protein